MFEHSSKGALPRGREQDKPKRSAAFDPLVIQRKCKQCDDEQERAPLQRDDVPGQQPAPSAAGSPIVDDGSPLGPGQMARSVFMAQVRSSLMTMCDAELAVVGRSAEGCPYIQHWLDVYDQKPAAELMRAIQLYTGVGPTSDAATLLGAVVGRVRGSVRTWVTSGEMTGVPGGVNPVDANAQPPADGQSPPPDSPVLTKREASGGTSVSPAVVRSSLGAGHALDGGVRARMESAFGQSFGDVRVHTGGTAATWNSNLAARAFTVGTDVAFGRGEYRPGTLEGDLLLAHELAHVTQQRGGAVSAARAGDPGLETEADRAAAAALGLLSPDEARLSQGRGLRLQRCDSTPKAPAVRPGMGVADPLAPGEETKSISLDDYIAAWERHQGRSMSADQRKMLAKGCVGITGLNLGGMASNGLPDNSECFDTFEHATARADELEKQKGSRPFIFSQRFWSDNKPYTPDPTTGRVDMSPYTNIAKPKPSGGTYVNFDYGWYDETTKTWFHANHCDPVTGSARCSATYDPSKRMKVYQSTQAHYSRPLADFDKQVYCVAWSKLP